MTRTSPASAVFVSTARDCARWLPDVLGNLARLARLYERTAFIFTVSDTNDSTAALLRDWMVNRRGRVIDLGDLATRLRLRTERIAHARNVGLAAARRGPDTVILSSQIWTTFSRCPSTSIPAPGRPAGSRLRQTALPFSPARHHATTTYGR